ncbi:MAG: MinD/ParA family protein [Negativicutes bacterium]|nr:MinD/ParA family protein [Negativicutes bacterium]
MRDQAESLRQMARNAHSVIKSAAVKQAKTQARVIAVTSGKGGVGKTNLTVNLALALANMDQKVLIIDADLGLANVEFIFGVSPQYNLMHFLDEGYLLNDIVVDGPRGVKFMSGGSGIPQLANLSEAHLGRIISQMVQFDQWADIIIVDTGAGLHRNVINFVMAADEVIIITTPEPTAIADAYAMMKTYAANYGRAPLKLVVNRVLDNAEGQMVVDKLIKVSLRFLGLSISSLGFVYEDPNMIKAVKSQVPLLLAHPASSSARCIENIAHHLLHGDAIVRPTGIKGFFNKFLGQMR